jgi:hypothetical protein
MQRTIQRLTAAWALAICLLLPVLTCAETAVQAWVQRYHGPGIGNDSTSSVAVDGSNSVVVVGDSWGTAGAYEYITIKYSSTGAPLWTNRYSGSGSVQQVGPAVVVDRSNDVIVTGNSTGSGGDWDYATIKYSSAGASLWTNCYSGPGNSRDCPTAVAVDGSNNVIVTGYSYNGTNDDYATIKYSSAGVPLWTNRYNGPANGWDHATAVAVDSGNQVIVTGGEASEGDPYYATIKYSSAGMPLWTNRYHGPESTFNTACAVAVDGSNDVIVTGSSTGSGGGSDYLTIKYSSAGASLWTNRYDGPGSGNDLVKVVGVDGSNNVIVVGTSNGGGSGSDYGTIKYSSAGVPLWTNRYNGPGNSYDEVRAVAMDDSNNVIVTGWSLGTEGTGDYATIKYSSGGVPLWTNRYNGSGNGDDQAVALAVDGTNNVIVAGTSYGSGTYYDFATIKYICVKEPVMTGLQLTNGSFQIEVDDVLQPGTLVIEACTDLAIWLPIFTNTTPTNVLFYADPDATNYPGRFYRAFQSP